MTAVPCDSAADGKRPDARSRQPHSRRRLCDGRSASRPRELLRPALRTFKRPVGHGSGRSTERCRVDGSLAGHAYGYTYGSVARTNGWLVAHRTGDHTAVLPPSSHGDRHRRALTTYAGPVDETSSRPSAATTAISGLRENDVVCAGPGNDTITDVTGWGVALELGRGNDRLDARSFGFLFAGRGRRHHRPQRCTPQPARPPPRPRQRPGPCHRPKALASRSASGACACPTRSPGTRCGSTSHEAWRTAREPTGSPACTASTAARTVTTSSAPAGATTSRTTRASSESRREPAATGSTAARTTTSCPWVREATPTVAAPATTAATEGPATICSTATTASTSCTAARDPTRSTAPTPATRTPRSCPAPTAHPNELHGGPGSDYLIGDIGNDLLDGGPRPRPRLRAGRRDARHPRVGREAHPLPVNGSWRTALQRARCVGKDATPTRKLEHLRQRRGATRPCPNHLHRRADVLVAAGALCLARRADGSTSAWCSQLRRLSSTRRSS